MEIRVNNINGLEEAASVFVSKLGGRRVYAFEGSMGAGKTTFIAAVCRALGVSDDVGSPTFSLVNEYRAGDGSAIYHFDFYRIDTPAEALEMGAEDYFYSGDLCLIEWPDRIGSVLPEDAVTVRIEEQSDGSRLISWEP